MSPRQLDLTFAALSLMEDDRRMVRFSGVVASAWLMGSLFGNYWISYRPAQMAFTPYPTMAFEIQRRVPPEGVVLIYGHDWNPTLPFASRRRAIMDRWAMPLDSERFQASIRATGKETIRAMVVPINAPRAFIQGRCQYFGFGSNPVVQVGNDALYLR